MVRNNPMLGKHHTEEAKQKMMGQCHSITTEFKKGRIPWNKGKKELYKHSEETKQKLKELYKTNDNFKQYKFKEGQIPWNKGVPMSEITKQKTSKNRKGKGLHPGVCFMKCPYPKTAFKKGIIFTIEQIKKQLHRNPKSSLEIKFEQVVSKLGLPYKFVGNGEVIIARKCPDFVNSNGEKIAIEVYYKRHKQMFRGGLEQWKAQRIKIFNQEGWEIIFFDETQVNENTVKSVLGN